jgi:hypothetical protein
VRIPRVSSEVRRELDRLGLELMREGSGREDPIYVRIDGLPIGHAFDRGDMGWMVYANHQKLGPSVAFPTFDNAVRAILQHARW